MTDSTPSHLQSPAIAAKLEGCPALWQTTIKGSGTITAYATAGGLVLFLDFERSPGWTMLTECPGATVRMSCNELRVMQTGVPALRGAR